MGSCSIRPSRETRRASVAQSTQVLSAVVPITGYGTQTFGGCAGGHEAEAARNTCTAVQAVRPRKASPAGFKRSALSCPRGQQLTCICTCGDTLILLGDSRRSRHSAAPRRARGVHPRDDSTSLRRGGLPDGRRVIGSIDTVRAEQPVHSSAEERTGCITRHGDPIQYRMPPGFAQPAEKTR